MHNVDRLDESQRLRIRRVETLFDALSDMAWIKDQDLRYVVANEAFARFLGRPREEILRRSDLELFSQEMAAKAEEKDRTVLETGKSFRSSEVTPGAPGKTLTLETTRHPIRDADGRPIGIAGIARDVTGQRELESQLLQSQKMEAVGRLAGGIAHDFNNILTAMTGYCEMLLGEVGRAEPGKTYAEEIRKGIERASGLTRQLLAFSRRQVLEPRVLDLDEVVANVGRMLHRLIGEDIELRLVKSEALWPVRADPGQLEQVIVNLAVNARDAMAGGGKLTIETRNVSLDESHRQKEFWVEPGDYVQLSAADTGAGMTAETRARLFEPFFTTKAPGKGTGLGLSTVYGIVKQSGGYIWVYSEPGQGTVFKIFLPRVAAAVERQGLPAPPADSLAEAREAQTILLVDDEPEVRSLIEKLLRREGYTILSASGPEEALSVGASHAGRIDLLVTDLGLPGTGGRKLSEEIIRSRPEIRVLYISGYTDDTVLRSGALEAGAAFLQKPFSPDALARKVRSVLDGPSAAPPND